MDFFDKLGDTLMTATKEVGQKAKGMSDLAKLQYELKCKEDDLKKELDSAICRLSYLISRINLTNCETKINGKTLTELIAEKDALAVKISVYKEIAYAASQTAYRATHTEIKIKPAIVVADWQKEIDAMAKELRLLDNKLQESNWNTDLIE